MISFKTFFFVYFWKSYLKWNKCFQHRELSVAITPFYRFNSETLLVSMNLISLMYTSRHLVSDLAQKFFFCGKAWFRQHQCFNYFYLSYRLKSKKKQLLKYEAMFSVYCISPNSLLQPTFNVLLALSPCSACAAYLLTACSSLRLTYSSLLVHVQRVLHIS